MRKNPREILFPQKRGTPITRVLEKLRKRETVTLGPKDISATPDKPELESQEKHEAYAIIAYFIEQVHSRVKLPDPAQPFKVPIRMTYPPEPHLRGVVSPEAAMSTLHLFDYTAFIKRAYAGFFATALREWEEDVIRQKKGAYDVRAYKRLQALIATLPRANDLSVEKFILRGANTAGEICWDVLRAIPLAFQATYGRTITKEEYEALATQAEPLVVMVASVHLETLQMMLRYAGEMGTREANRAELGFPLEFFAVEKGKGDAPVLRFKEETLEKFDAYVKEKGLIMNQMRFRCPALDVRVPTDTGEQNLISVVYTFYREVARAYLEPQLERYTEEGRKRMDTPKV